MAEHSDDAKIQIDSDWKAQAQAEKKKMAEKAQSQQQAGGGQQAAGAPPEGFEGLLSTMVTQALFALGAFPDPQTGQRMAHLELARHHIDMLGVLEEKTKGNLTDEEEKALTTTLYELRNRYVQVAQTARDQQAGAQGAQAGGQGGAGGPQTGTDQAGPASGPIVT